MKLKPNGLKLFQSTRQQFLISEVFFKEISFTLSS